MTATYQVKEIYYTLQGEGLRTGRAAVFLRFSACNLWSGREADRETALCRFCDTDFVGTDGPGGGEFASPDALADAVAKTWPAESGAKGAAPYVVCTGGEPLLQLDAPLVDALHARGFEVAVETNGTITPPPGLDWTCVSPKAGARLRVTRGDELKLIYPQDGLDPDELEHLEFMHFLVQPMDDGSGSADNIAAATRFCLAHPRWRLSLQTHKTIGIR